MIVEKSVSKGRVTSHTLEVLIEDKKKKKKSPVSSINKTQHTDF